MVRYRCGPAFTWEPVNLQKSTVGYLLPVVSRSPVPSSAEAAEGTVAGLLVYGSTSS